MSRRSTHLSRLARLVQARTALTYTQALALARAAQQAGALPTPLDDAGLKEAARRLAAGPDTQTGTPADGLGSLTLGHAPDGTPVCLGRDQLLKPTAIFGASRSGRSGAAASLAAGALAQGWAVLLVDGGGAVLDDWARRHTTEHGLPLHRAPIGELLDLTRPGLTYVTGPTGDAHAAGLVNDETLRAVSTLITARTFTRTSGRAPHLVVLNDADRLDHELLHWVLARTRAGGVAVVMVSAGPSSWDTWPRLALSDVEANTSTLVALRAGSTADADILAARIDPGDDSLPDLLLNLSVGRGYVVCLDGEPQLEPVQIA